jgi:hypothetical protein
VHFFTQHQAFLIHHLAALADREAAASNKWLFIGLIYRRLLNVVAPPECYKRVSHAHYFVVQ